MATGKFIKDGSVLWLQVPKVGTPPVWAPGTDYKIGDTVVPTTVITGLENSMFQCIGFIGKSAVAQPTFPVTIAGTVVDNNILWTARSPNGAPPKYEKHQFVVIDEEVTVSS